MTGFGWSRGTRSAVAMLSLAVLAGVGGASGTQAAPGGQGGTDAASPFASQGLNQGGPRGGPQSTPTPTPTAAAPGGQLRTGPPPPATNALTAPFNSQAPGAVPTATPINAPSIPFAPGVGPLMVLPSPIPSATPSPTTTLTPTVTSIPTATTPPTATGTPLPSIRAPLNLRMVSSGPQAGTYSIAWDALNVESVLEYRVYGVGADGDRRRLFTLPGSGSEAVLSGLDPAIGYSLVLEAVDTRGRESLPSNVVFTAGAPTATPPIPAYLNRQPYGTSGAQSPGVSPYAPAGSPYTAGAPGVPPAGPGVTTPPSIYAPSGTAGQPIPPSPYQPPLPPGSATAPRPLR